MTPSTSHRLHLAAQPTTSVKQSERAVTHPPPSDHACSASAGPLPIRQETAEAPSVALVLPAARWSMASHAAIQ